jgi:hypothetical protein
MTIGSVAIGARANKLGRSVANLFTGDLLVTVTNPGGGVFPLFVVASFRA